MIDSKYIKQYMLQNSFIGSMEKGENLYMSGAIKDIEQSDKDDIIKAKVQGSLLYTVRVVFLGTKIVSSCSCPYNYGGICKHTVAVLLHISENADNKTNSYPKIKRLEKQKMRNSSTPFKIENYTAASKGTDYGYYYTEDNIFPTAVKENYIRMKIDSWNVASSVELWYEKDDLYSKCSCNENTKGLCKHEKIVLKHIITNYEKNFLPSLKEENIFQRKKELASSLGLGNAADLNSLFDLRFVDNKIELIPTGQASGLVNLNKGSVQENSLIKLINNNFNKLSEGKDNEFYELGYVFVFRSNSENGYSELIPITGKLNKSKNKLINPIRPLNGYDNESVQLSGSDEELIRLSELTSEKYIKDYIDHSGLSYSDDTISKKKLVAQHFEKLFPEIKKILANKQFVNISNAQYFTSTDLKPVKVQDKTVNLIFTVNEDKLFFSLDLMFKIGDIEIQSNNQNLNFYFPLAIEYMNELYFLEKAQDGLIAEDYINRGSGIKTTKTKFPELFDTFIKPISEKYTVEFQTNTIMVDKQIPESVKKQLYISELGKFVLFKPYVLYDNKIQANILEQGSLIRYNKNRVTETLRNNEYEKEYYRFFKDLHSAFKDQFNEDFLYLKFEDFVKNQWFLTAFETMKGADIEVFGLKDFKNFKYSTHKAQVSLNISSGQDWFDVNIELSFGDEQISLKDIKKAIRKNDNFIKLSDGKLGILPEKWLNKFQRYFRQGDIRKDSLKISKLRFSVIDELFDEKDYLEIMTELADKRKRLKEFTEIKNVRKPKKLKGELRDYQKAGYNWLNFLDEFKWGGILADDMGLGKTAQILAFLLKKSYKTKKASLIIVPTTLLFNWENEVEKFTPSLEIFFHYGPERAKDTKNFKGKNIVITTYGTMTRDIELLRKHKFHYIILDESQAIKNPQSKRFKATTLLRADNKLALTGTPIENNTFDLYAQMEFLNPGFLGNQKQFKENYSNAIDRDQNPEIAAELQNLISPFILRRTKEQVATELPPKTEDFLFCEMESEQRKVYEAFRNKYRNMLLNRIEEDGLGKSKIYVLQGLMKLRQICDSPGILSDDENYGSESIKIKELIRHIKQKTGKHKVLVFSQFVKMLSLIRKELDENEITYEYLDGKSSKKARQQSVETFQNDEKYRVFLISLKAGGTGLNLTAADYVYIVDPWWNPAVENQAIDRCYRIGQEKKVIAYRMICKNTIEEKIMKYQEKKQKIASEIISTDDSFVKQLDKNDIEDLFA